MRRLAWKGTGVFSALAAVFAVIWLARGPGYTAGSGTVLLAPGRWHLTWPEKDSFKNLPEHFDFSAKVTLSGGSSSAVRMLVNASPGERDGSVERAAFVQIGSSAVAVGRIESGFALAMSERPLDITGGIEHEVMLKRRGAELAVVIDGQVAMVAVEPHLHGGRAAVGASGDARVELRPVARLTDLPEFSDDFMRTADEPGPWALHSGKWKIERIATPSMSANGFTYRGRASGRVAALVSAGNPRWDRYRAEVSVRGEAGGRVGIAFAFRGGDRYALFRWRARHAAGGGASEGNERELVLVEPGRWEYPRETVVARAPGGYAPRQWYRLAVEFDPGRARVLVDGHEVLRAERPEFASGAVGLWCEGAEGAIFDDVLVVPSHSVEEVFADAGAGPSWRARWEAIGGDWRLDSGGLVLRKKRRLGRGAKLLTGSHSWRRLAAEAEIGTGRGPAGLVVNYRDEGDHVLLKFDRRRGRCVLERVLGGEPRVLDEADAPGEVPLTLRLESDRGYLAGCVNGSRVVEGYDESSTHGRAGLWCSAPRSAAFRSFRAKFLAHRAPITTTNLVFGADVYMSDWAGEWADWYTSAQSKGDRRIYWHQSPFHGDVEFAIDLPEIDPPRGGKKVVVAVAKSGSQPGDGYGWALGGSPPGDGPAGTRWHTTLTRQGAVEGQAALDSGRTVESLFLRKQGRYVVGGYDGETVTVFRDEEPLAGSRVAFLTQSIAAGPSRVRLYGELVHDYRFGKAPADWRIAAGIWEIANRWECDQRWSFFIGWPTDWPRATPGKELTAVWNKRLFPGDVMVDFFVGPKMTRLRGERYQYARDFNVTISGDGRDLTSGYTFMFAGDGNKRTAILRGGKVLAESKDPRSLFPGNSMIAHQRWFHVRAKRTGNRLEYRVSFLGHLLVKLKAVDPEPLAGDRVAVWSYDCGIVIARMRIAASAPGELEDPGFQAPRRVRTPYDKEAKGAADHKSW